MRVLVSGHNGYIGSVLVPTLVGAGHDVVGLDTFFYDECTYGPDYARPAAVHRDVRDVGVEDLMGFDAVMHLAALSNDPVGDLRPSITYDINHEGSRRLARLAKDAAVPRFLFASSCSLYGASAGDAMLDEHAAFNPVTPYGESKIWSERDILTLADDNFSPTFLRNATAYGFSPRLRSDVVVNNLVGYAVATHEVLLQTDGSQWRPLVHVEDICRAFLTALEAPRDAVHGEAFNVGSTAENYRIRDVARIVQDVVPGSRVTLSGKAGPDLRNYRVNCDKLATRLGFQTKWTVERGALQMLGQFERHGLTLDQLTGPRMQRLPRLKELLASSRLDDNLRWTQVHAGTTV
ncbi:MAG TPA: SDR family oxidoreductase [Vicinamibacterales bacterium]|jgi:nucleoside-diphosphate-sugar epimerase|nr:SDR family oxidoreductase [Vicinamibacterales bacterium]